MFKDEAVEEDQLVNDDSSDEGEEDEGEDPIPPDQVESSLDELLAKKEKPEAEAAGEPEEAAIIAPSAPEDRVEPLPAKVVPKQSNEFTCRNCFLVKHRSQLANKKRMLCRDCA